MAINSRPLWQRTLFAVLVFLLILLAALPELVRIGASYVVEDSGLGKLSLEDININPFTATIELEGLDFQHQGKTTLRVAEAQLDISWQGWLDDEWRIDRLALSGVQLAVREDTQGNLDIIIPLSLLESDDAEPESVTTEPSTTESSLLPRLSSTRLELHDIAIEVEALGLSGTMGIQQLQLDNLSSWRTQPAKLSVQASWRQAPITIQLQGHPQSGLIGSIAIDALPLVGFTDIANSFIDNTIQGQLNDLQGALHSDLKLELQAPAADTWEKVLQSELDWQINGEIGLMDLAVTAQTDQTQTSSTQEIPLLGLKQLSISNFSVAAPGTLRADSIRLEDLSVLPALHQATEQQAWSHFGLLSIEQLSADTQAATLNAITLQDWQQQLTVLESGEVFVQQQLATLLPEPVEQIEEQAEEATETPPDNTEAQTASTEGEQPGYQLNLKRFEIKGNSQLHLNDQSVSPAIDETISIKQLLISDISTQSDKPLSIKLDTGIGEFGSLSLNGQSTMLSAPEDLAKTTAELTIKALPLPPFTGYAEQAVGYQVQAGQFDHQLTLNIEGSALNIENKLDIRQLKLEKSSEKTSTFEQQLPMPLNLALSLLRDKDDNIHLKVPLSGQLDDPNINASQIINKALSTALQKASTSYLKYSLQPYGALLLVSEIAADKIKKPGLQAVQFAPGQSVIKLDQVDYLDKVSKLLTDRPGLNLKLCGIAATEDIAFIASAAEVTEAGSQTNDHVAAQSNNPTELSTEQKESLTQLASARADTLKHYWIEQGVDASRLFICKSAIDLKKAEGRVMLEF